MWPDRRVIDLLEIEHPIISSPMAGLAPVKLAGAVSVAGGLGMIGCAGMKPDTARDAIESIREITTRPFGVNFFCHASAPVDSARAQAWRERLRVYCEEFAFEFDHTAAQPSVPPFDDAMCDMVEQTRPPVVSFHFGLPSPALVDRVKAAGCIVMCSATTVAEALFLESRGVDIVIAQGLEAGGHRGTFLASDLGVSGDTQMGTFALTPQVADEVDIPVVAAGGVADGRGVAAAFALGAAGVQIGTAFLLCPEATISARARDALRRADSLGTVVTNVFSGRPARALSNRLSREIGPISPLAPPFPGAGAATLQLRMAAERRGTTDFSPVWAGQSAALGRTMPAAILMDILVSEARERFNMLQTRSSQTSPRRRAYS